MYGRKASRMGLTPPCAPRWRVQAGAHPGPSTIHADGSQAHIDKAVYCLTVPHTMHM